MPAQAVGHGTPDREWANDHWLGAFVALFRQNDAIPASFVRAFATQLDSKPLISLVLVVIWMHLVVGGDLFREAEPRMHC